MRSGLNIVESVSALLKWAESSDASGDTSFVLVPLLDGRSEESCDVKGAAYIIDDSIVINGLVTQPQCEGVATREVLRHMQSLYRSFTEIYNSLCIANKQQKIAIVGGIELFSEKFLLNTFTKWYRKYRVKGIAIVADDVDRWKQFDIMGGHIAAYINDDFKTADLFKVARIELSCNDKGQLKPSVYVDVNKESHPCTIPENNIGALVKRHISPGATLLMSRKFGSWKYLCTMCESIGGDNVLLDSTSKCPFCGSPTVWDGSMSELSCSNEDCTERQKAMSVRFFTAFGMSREDITRLIDAGFCRIESILGMSHDEISALFGEHAETISSMIYEIRTNPGIFQMIEASSCFDNIDKTRLGAIIGSFDDATMNDFCKGWYNPIFDPNSLYGGKASRVMYDFAMDVKAFHEFAERYNLPIMPPRPFADDWKGKFASQTIAFCGLNLSMYRTITRMVRAEKGKIVASVTKKTSMLVVNKPQTRSQKMIDARHFLVPIVPLDKFIINLRYKKHYEKHITTKNNTTANENVHRD